MQARLGAGEQRVFLVISVPPALLNRGMFGMAPPGMDSSLAYTFGNGNDSPIFGLVALEGQEPGLHSRQRLHALGIGGIGSCVEVGALAVAEYN